jgi:hypothetical protein
MNKKALWFGYLDAGGKSSPIVMDPMLSTGNNNTLYLYNHSRGSILEYQRVIVEPKLRELNDGEADVKDLRKAYKKIKVDFTPKGGRLQKAVELPAPSPKASPPPEEVPEIDEDFDDDMDLDD